MSDKFPSETQRSEKPDIEEPSARRDTRLIRGEEGTSQRFWVGEILKRDISKQAPIEIPVEKGRT